MAHLTVEQHVHAPIEAVFDGATDFSNNPQVIEGIESIEMLTEGPVGLGTRFKETRIMFGRPAHEVMEVTAFEPPNRFVLGAESHGSRYRSTYTLTEESGGTKLVLRFEGEPLTLFAKVMSVLMKPMIKSMAKLCAKDLQDLATSVEKRAGS